MIGTSATTGKPLGDLDHLRQSIIDILTTPIGSRVKRRTYGSRLFSLIDAPMNRETLMDIYAATIDAISTWETRIQITKVQSSTAGPGSVTLDMYGIYLPTGQPVAISGVTVAN